jgi:hypothetical protein
MPCKSQLQNVVRARTREPTGNDFYNYNIVTRNFRATMGSGSALDRTDVRSTDTPFVQFGVNA